MEIQHFCADGHVLVSACFRSEARQVIRAREHDLVVRGGTGTFSLARSVGIFSEHYKCFIRGVITIHQRKHIPRSLLSRFALEAL